MMTQHQGPPGGTQDDAPRAVGRDGDSRYRALFHGIDEGFCIVEVREDGPDKRIDYRVIEANDAFYERTGFPRSILNCWLRDAAPDLEDHWYDAYGGVARSGTPVRFEQESKALGRWFDVFAFRPEGAADGHVAILFNDISERKRLEEQTQYLLQELNHRSKNMITLIQAIARQTTHADPKTFLDRFGARLGALSAAQDVLISNAGAHVPVADLVASQLAHLSDLSGNRVAATGPALTFLPAAAQSVGMALHELATNAAKYGALANEAGRIVVDWSVEESGPDGRRFAMSWTERGGPTVTPPARQGFGSVVTRRLLESGTGGKVEIAYDPEGVTWQFGAPAARVLAEDG